MERISDKLSEIDFLKVPVALSYSQISEKLLQKVVVRSLNISEEFPSLFDV